MLEHLAHLIVWIELVAVQPYALTHQKWVVVHTFGCLNLKAVQQLVGNQVEQFVQFFIEALLVVVRLDGNARQVDGSKGQVSSAVADFSGWVVDVAHHAGAAAHGGYLGLRASRFIILKIERCIQKDVVREQSLGAHLAGEFEQIVVRVAFVVVDPFLYLEYMDWEDAGFPMTQTGVGRQQDVADDHSALR